MTRSQNYPGADRSKYFPPRVMGASQSTITKLVLHSTETRPSSGCPGYRGGLDAPTLTVNPWPGHQRIWQHFPANMSAKALVDPGSTLVRENRDNVAQIEIIGYSDQGLARRYGGNLRELPEAGLAYLAHVIAWYHDEWGVPLRTPALWPMYPASGGNSPARMSGSTYDAFTGVLGHLHVSGNSHGDPSIRIDALLSATRKLTGGTTTPTPDIPTEEPEMAQTDIDTIHEKLDILLGRLPGNTPQALARIDARVGAADSARNTWTYDAVKDVVIPILQELASEGDVDSAKLDEIIARLEELGEPEVPPDPETPTP